MDYIITTEQLTKKYKNFTSVNHVSLHIRKGSIYGFLGPNGAGKSTTMKMLLGLTTPTKGSFTIDGKQFPQDRIAILKEIGSFIEAPSFYANLTGRENLDIIRRILGLPKADVKMLWTGRADRVWRPAGKTVFAGNEATLGPCRGALGASADSDSGRTHKRS